MSGIHGHIFGHLAKRGYEAVQEHVRRGVATGSAETSMAQMQHDAVLYDLSPDMAVNEWEMVPIGVTALLTILLVVSIKYTIGEVMASLAMIESPVSTTTAAAKSPVYADEPNAPVEKEALLPAEAEADVELSLASNKPITANMRSTVKHLTRIGGFRARWRGAGVSLVYHLSHSLVTHFLATMLGLGVMGDLLVSIVASVGLARLHMLWTHSMIAYPSSQPFYRRFVPREHCRAILLPSFVFAAAQQATIALPVAVAFGLGLSEINHSHVMDAAARHDCRNLMGMSVRFLAVPATAIFVAIAVLLPATVTLTRIEALLLPEGEDTIVPFDRQAIIGDLDITAKGSSRALFVRAWKSFDTSARWRLIQLYLNMIALHISIIFVSVHLLIAEMYIIGADRFALLFSSVSAQANLAASLSQQGH